MYLVQMEQEHGTLVLKKIRFSFYHLIHQRYQAWDRFPINVVAVSSQITRTLCCLIVRLNMNSMLLDKWRKEGSSPALHTSDGRSIVPLAQQLRVCAFINCTQGQVGFICFFVLFFVCVSCCGCISVLAVLAHSFLSLRSFEFCTVSNSWFG